MLLLILQVPREAARKSFRMMVKSQLPKRLVMQVTVLWSTLMATMNTKTLYKTTTSTMIPELRMWKNTRTS